MDKFPERKPVRLKGYNYNSSGMYFVTICTVGKRCILSRIVGTGVLDGPRIELLPYGEIADEQIKRMDAFYNNISVKDYVIMPNHIHILLEIMENGPSGTPVPTIQNSTLSRFISTFKRFCNREYGHNVWQQRSYDHIIRDQEDYDKHLEYIYENPFKWERDSLYPYGNQ